MIKKDAAARLGAVWRSIVRRRLITEPIQIEV